MRITAIVCRLAFALTVPAILLGSGAVCSQNYPNRPIRLIVPNAAGGPADGIARMLAQKLPESIGQPIVVDNRAGAGGIIGTEMVAKAPADGYTLMWISINHAINPSVYAKLPYDAIRDFAAVTLAASGPLLLAVHPSVAANDVKSLLALDRAKPGELTGASAGSGSISHLTLELLNYMAGSRLVHVPYKGAGQALTDVLGGHVSIYFGNVLGLLPHVRTGKLKGLAVSTQTRSAAAPNIPTVAESGVQGYEASSWFGVMAPAATPAPIIARLNEAFVRQLKASDTQERLAANGAEVVASSAAQFSAYFAAEIGKWEKVVKAAGVKAD